MVRIPRVRGHLKVEAVGGRIGDGDSAGVIEEDAEGSRNDDVSRIDPVFVYGSEQSRAELIGEFTYSGDRGCGRPYGVVISPRGLLDLNFRSYVRSRVCRDAYVKPKIPIVGVRDVVRGDVSSSGCAW